MSEEKNNLPILPAEAVIQQLEGKCSEYEATIGSLREQITELEVQRKALEAENKDYIHRLNCLEDAWKKADEDYTRMVSVRDNLLSTTHQLADDLEGERATNKMLIDGILDLVRKIMEA